MIQALIAGATLAAILIAIAFIGLDALRRRKTALDELSVTEDLEAALERELSEYGAPEGNAGRIM